MTNAWTPVVRTIASISILKMRLMVEVLACLSRRLVLPTIIFPYLHVNSMAVQGGVKGAKDICTRSVVSCVKKNAKDVIVARTTLHPLLFVPQPE